MLFQAEFGFWEIYFSFMIKILYFFQSKFFTHLRKIYFHRETMVYMFQIFPLALLCKFAPRYNQCFLWIILQFQSFQLRFIQLHKMIKYTFI